MIHVGEKGKLRDRPSLPFGHLPLYGEKAFRMDTLPRLRLIISKE